MQFNARATPLQAKFASGVVDDSLIGPLSALKSDAATGSFGKLNFDICISFFMPACNASGYSGSVCN
jgi:hypothetical protein